MDTKLIWKKFQCEARPLTVQFLKAPHRIINAASRDPCVLLTLTLTLTLTLDRNPVAWQEDTIKAANPAIQSLARTGGK